MSFTRTRNDPSRLMKESQIFSYPGRYQLNTPGQGVNLPFIEDPHIRLEKWGANNRTNIVEIENDLKGINRKLNRDHLHEHEYNKFTIRSHKINYPNDKKCITDDSRHTHPAYQYVDKEVYRWESPLLNPQKNLEIPFSFNVQTRILYKDSLIH